MKSLKIILILLVGLSCSTDLYSQIGLNKLAQSTMNFQLVSISPKASAMGEAFYTVGIGAESMFYNPAGMAETPHTFDVSLNYTQWIADIKYLGGAVAYDMGTLGTVGFSLLSVDYGTIYGADLAPSATSPSGYIETGTLSNVGAYSVGLSYARAISNQFSIGGTARLVGQNLGSNTFTDGTSRDNNATKLVFDAGVLYNTGYKNISFGMALRNFGSNVRREEIEEQLPLTFTMGAAVDIWQFITESTSEQLTVAVDFLHSNSFSERINIGAEYRFLGMLALRAGYQSNRDVASWSTGIGFNTSISDYDLEVNYSFSKMDIFNNISRLSVNFAF